MAHSPHLLQGGLDVPEIVDEIGEDDDVERLIEDAIVNVRLDEVEIWIARAGAREHFGRKVDTAADRRFKRGEEIALRGAKLGDFQSWGDEVAVDLRQPAAVAAAKALARVTGFRERIPMVDPALAVVKRGGIGDGCEGVVHL